MRLLLVVLLAAAPAPAQHPRDAEIHDADTKAWWHTTEDLSSDAMEGRDTGSDAYRRAADIVARRFGSAGLKPAGENGTYLQTVPMHQVQVDPQGTSFRVLRDDGASVPLAFLEQITVAASASLQAINAPLVFRGYCGKDAMSGISGKAVVCFGTQRGGLPTAADRTSNARAGGAAALINVDDPFFTIEPPRWPFAYARSVTITPSAPATSAPTQPAPTKPDGASPLPVMRISAAAFPLLIEGAGQTPAALLAAGGKKEALASFEIPARLEAHFALSAKEISSPNVLALLPGSDPALKDQIVAISAHLDGYGFGTPVAGDRLYNGALDDAAYVALLIQIAEDLKAEHRPLKRSVLFCVFTGEEKGLLGSNYFVEHLTVAKEQLAADVNLDQLRPLFPLKILTALAVDQTTLGATARDVATGLGIEIRPDREPERGLLHRADQWPFLRIGVPAISFIFGYDPGTDAERRYREWYQVRYHRPQDDLTQPINFAAAASFDGFFYKLVQTLADTPERPRLLRTDAVNPPPGDQRHRNGPKS